MLRVYVVVEGQTESVFVDNVLAPYYWPVEISLTAPILGTSGHKGGGVNYVRVRDHVRRLLSQDRHCRCTTLLDLYGLGRGFPGEERTFASTAERADHLEARMIEDVDDARFLPYLQRHEFEALLFSDCTALSLAIGVAREPLEAIRSAVPTPEDIDSGVDTAPSKRILRLKPGYKKVLEGNRAAQKVGIQGMREECPRFRRWTDQLAAFV